MATKQSRGTKRTCQNDECGTRFYDLERNPIICPICESKYVIASSPAALAALQAEEKVQRNKPKKPVFVEDQAAEEAAPEAEEALADVETDETPAAEDDETFLEEEEEPGGDVSNIIGGPVAEGPEEV